MNARMLRMAAHAALMMKTYVDLAHIAKKTGTPEVVKLFRDIAYTERGVLISVANTAAIYEGVSAREIMKKAFDMANKRFDGRKV